MSDHQQTIQEKGVLRKCLNEERVTVQKKKTEGKFSQVEKEEVIWARRTVNILSHG